MGNGASPATVGRYRIVDLLGRGGMGCVYRAHDPHTDREVALKVLAVADDRPEDWIASARARFLVEARAAGRLSHPGIVLVYDADIDAASGAPFIAMEIVAGRSLARLIAEEGRLPWRRATSIAARIADALDHAHARGVVHRDLKPPNVLIADDGAIKISDFGVAKLAGESNTEMGMVVGTPAYMAPEQLLGQPIDGRTDLYSVGAVLYEMLTAESAFQADSLVGVAHNVLHVDPRPPSSVRPDVPPELDRIILRALAKSADDRPPSGRVLAAELRAVGQLDDATQFAQTTPLPLLAEAMVRPFTRRRRAFAVGVAVVLLAVAIGLWAGHRDSTPDSPEAAASSGPNATAPAPAFESPRPPPAPQPSNELVLPAASEIPTPPTSAQELSATLEIGFANRIRDGRITVWIDGDPAWSAPLAASGNLFQRLVSEPVTASLPVAAGGHDIEIQVVSASHRVDAHGSTHAELGAAQLRRLRVSLFPFRSKLTLKWDS